MIIDHPPSILKSLFPTLEWEIKTSKKEIFLTFDDGPTPGVTDQVLSILKEFEAKATFFCVGQNVENHPLLYEQIITEGHLVGNHTFSHLNGWKSHSWSYRENVARASEYISSNFFRPPYGRLKSSQIATLKQDFRIIMWSHLSRDYDHRLSIDDSLSICLKNLKPGSILVFHDSLKASTKVIPLVRLLLQEIKYLGFQANAIY